MFAVLAKDHPIPWGHDGPILRDADGRYVGTLDSPESARAIAGAINCVEDLIAETTRPTSLLAVGDLVMDLHARTITRGGVLRNVRPQCFRVLECLMRRPGVTVSPSQIHREAWGGEHLPRSYRDRVTVAIFNLRTSLDDREGSLVANRRGYGYLVIPPTRR